MSGGHNDRKGIHVSTLNHPTTDPSVIARALRTQYGIGQGDIAVILTHLVGKDTARVLGKASPQMGSFPEGVASAEDKGKSFYIQVLKGISEGTVELPLMVQYSMIICIAESWGLLDTHPTVFAAKAALKERGCDPEGEHMWENAYTDLIQPVSHALDMTDEEAEFFERHPNVKYVWQVCELTFKGLEAFGEQDHILPLERMLRDCNPNLHLGMVFPPKQRERLIDMTTGR